MKNVSILAGCGDHGCCFVILLNSRAYCCDPFVATHSHFFFPTSPGMSEPPDSFVGRAGERVRTAPPPTTKTAKKSMRMQRRQRRRHRRMRMQRRRRNRRMRMRRQRRRRNRRMRMQRQSRLDGSVPAKKSTQMPATKSATVQCRRKCRQRCRRRNRRMRMRRQSRRQRRRRNRRMRMRFSAGEEIDGCECGDKVGSAVQCRRRNRRMRMRFTDLSSPRKTARLIYVLDIL